MAAQSAFIGISDIASTPEFQKMCKQLEEVVDHYRRETQSAAITQDLGDIRFSAGRVAGLEIVLQLMQNARKGTRH